MVACIYMKCGRIVLLNGRNMRLDWIYWSPRSSSHMGQVAWHPNITRHLKPQNVFFSKTLLLNSFRLQRLRQPSFFCVTMISPQFPSWNSWGAGWKIANRWWLPSDLSELHPSCQRHRVIANCILGMIFQEVSMHKFTGTVMSQRRGRISIYTHTFPIPDLFGRCLCDVGATCFIGYDWMGQC